MSAIKFAFLAMLVALCAFSVRVASATSPFTATRNDPNENMENDVDAYTPTDTDPLNDPNLEGLPPGVGHPDAGLPYGSPGADWIELRTGGVGVIEEVPSGFAGTAPAPDGSAHIAIVQFEGGDGPYGRSNRDRFNGPTTGPAPIGPYWATTDLYVDGSIAYGGPDGMDDFSWINSFNSNVTNDFLSQSGLTGTVDPSGTTWTFRTTAGNALIGIGAVAIGTWIGLETEPIPSVVFPGRVAFENRLMSADRLTVLGYFIEEDYLAGANGGYAELAGPRANWFTDAGPNMTHLFVDNGCWAGPVPEPSTLVLASFGAVGLAAAAAGKRRRLR